jgi:uncharacterized protein (TIGR02594 family)
MRELAAVIGTAEVPGAGTNPLIAEMHASLGQGVESDEVAWCSAAVAWSFQQCGMRIPECVTRAARSWLHAHKYLDMLKEPCRGAIAVLWRESLDSWKGHVGLVEARGFGRLVLLGGNQDNSVGIKSYSEERVIGYMWPRCFNPEEFPLHVSRE